MDIHDLEKLIKERRSIRRWTKKEVPDDLIKKGIELGTWAPNGGNYQGWRFIAVKNREVKNKLADAVQRITDKVASWPEAEAWREDVDRYRNRVSFFREASVVLAVLASQYRSVTDKVLLARESVDREAQEVMAFRRSAPTSVQSVAAAVTTMLLVVQQMGLGAIWLGAPLMAKREIETILKVPAGLDLTSLVAVGYADESPQRTRKPVEEVLEFVR